MKPELNAEYNPHAYQVPRPPQFLGGWREIANAFGVTGTQPKLWFDLGAPIVLLKKRPVAEAWELWCWLKEEYG